MPASTYEPIQATLRNALKKPRSPDENTLDEELAGSTKKALLADIEFESAGTYSSTVLDRLKSKYIVLSNENTNKIPNISVKKEDMGGDETLKSPKHELYPLNAVQLGWGNCDWAVGAGMVNVGNTCYLNSTLQALYHVPALVNWLISDKQNCSECEEGTYICIICAMRQTLQQSQQRNTNSIRPYLIYNKLRNICKNFLPGHQEDAHEFLRYLVEAMEKSYLCRYKNYHQFDGRTKETTPLNQILGGYLRSTVRCCECEHISTTFQHFQDLLLDVRKAQSLEDALETCFTREQLDDESYHCENCKKKVRAMKQFSLERAPMVLCIQLKRFSVTNNKISKHISFKQRLELTKFAINKPSTPLVYRLVALVSHLGPTVSCGHYIAVAQAPCGNFYLFDDSNVRPISHQDVFNTNAYIMLYELEMTQTHKTQPTNGTKLHKPSLSTKILNASTSPASNSNNNNNNNNNKSLNGSISNSVVYGPELPPPNKLLKLEDTNDVVSSTRNGVHDETSSSTSSSSSSSSSSPSSDSETEQVTSKNHKDQTMVVTPNKQTFSGTDAKKLPIKTLTSKTSSPLSHHRNNNASASSSSSSSSSTITANNKHKNEGVTTTNSSSFKKLVPYDEDSSSNDSRSNEGKVSARAANGEWFVTSSTNNTPSSKNNTSNTVSQLLKMSHDGYSSNSVLSWNGTRSNLSKQVNLEKREERKRPHGSDDEQDQGRVKHVKTSNGKFKSNPGFNPIQDFHNSKNWTNGNSSYRQFYNGSKHRNRRFHHRRNYKNFRYGH